MIAAGSAARSAGLRAGLVRGVGGGASGLGARRRRWFASGTAGEPREGEQREGEQRKVAFPVVMTGTPADGKEIIETLGLATSTSVLSRNILTDVAMAVLGVLGGPARQYEELTSDAVVRATDGVATAAQRMGADQVINFRIEKAVLVNRLVFGVYVFVTAYGTAVRVRDGPKTAAAEHRAD